MYYRVNGLEGLGVKWPSTVGSWGVACITTPQEVERSRFGLFIVMACLEPGYKPVRLDIDSRNVCSELVCLTDQHHSGCMVTWMNNHHRAVNVEFYS